ncbi:MAG TPA: hypothetical protein VIF62_20070 [Labilithrix sp.]
MLPVRKSSPVRRSSAIAVEIRVPSLGMSFAALASRVDAESMFLSTFVDIDAGTQVLLAISLPDGRIEAEGVVSSAPTAAGGMVVELTQIEDALRERLARVA